MKKRVIYLSFIGLSLLSSTLFTSCDRVKEAVNSVAEAIPFDISLNINDKEAPLFTMPTIGQMWDYGVIPLNIDADAEIRKQNPNLNISHLRSAKLKSFQIELNSGEGINADLASVSGAEIYIIGPGLPERLVATASGNTNPKLLTFETKSDEELVEYFKQKENSIRLKLKSEKISAAKVNVNFKPTFTVRAGI